MRFLAAVLCLLTSFNALAAGPYIWFGNYAKDLTATGGLEPDGSAATPSHSFINDLGMGFYRIGSSQLGISTNGTNAVIVDATQQVGIGITPTSGLELGNNKTLKVNPGDFGYMIELGALNGSGGGITQHGGNAFTFTSHNSGSFLAIQDDAVDGGILAVGGKDLLLSVNASSATAKVAVAPSVIQTADIFDIENNAGTVLSGFDINGNLGIQKTSPGSALDVKGIIRMSGSSSGFVGLQGAAAAGSTTYTLPAADGTDGYALTTNGAGILRWAIAPIGSIGTFDSGTPSANGAHIDSNALIMQSASASNPGLVNTSTQTMAGNKTFSGSVTAATAIVSDTSGSGYLELPSEGTNHPAAPAAGVRLYNTVGTDRLYLKGTSGKEAILDFSLLTTNRRYQFPDSGSSTAALLTDSSTATLTNKSIDASQLTSTVALINGGTGTAAGSANAAFNALSPLTTKGDLLSFSTVNARLPVGSDTQVLTADSAQTLGVKWSAAATGTVTSVAMTVPTFLSVSGSPVTGAGTLGVTLSGTALPAANGGTGVVSTATFPTSGVVVTEAATETLTNKTISTASNTITAAAAAADGIVNQTSQTMSGAKTWNDVQTFKYSSGATTAGSYNTSGIWTIGNTGAIGGSSYAGNQIVGKTDGSATSAGYAGEQFLISRLATNGLSLTSNISANIGTTTNLTLTPGFWLITGCVTYKSTAATTNENEFASGVSNTSATLPAAGTIGVPNSTGEYRIQIDPTVAGVSGNSSFFTMPFSYVANINASSTLYLIGTLGFTGVGATAEGSGYLKAIRIL